MLVLSRKVNESVTIRCPDGTEISVMLVEVRGRKARLGFTAPDECVVHRDEVWEEIRQEVA